MKKCINVMRSVCDSEYNMNNSSWVLPIVLIVVLIMYWIVWIRES